MSRRVPPTTRSDGRPLPGPTPPGRPTNKATVVVVTASGNQLNFDEAQLRSYWERGFLEPGIRCWRDGMAQFISVDEYFAHKDAEDVRATASSPAEASRRHPPGRREESGIAAECEQPRGNRGPRSWAHPRTAGAFRDIRGIGVAAIALLWATAILDAAGVYGRFRVHAFLDNPGSMEEAAQLDALQGILGGLNLLLLLATAIVFLIWLYKATANMRDVSGDVTRFKPGWAVGCWFIPIVNLCRPYQYVRDLWLASVGGEDTDEKSHSLVKWWWGLWLAATFLGTRALITTPSSPEAVDVESIQKAMALYAMSGLCRAAAAVVMTAVVRKISHAQWAEVA